MELTMEITALPDGTWKASISERPDVFGGIFYIGEREVVEDRMRRLLHALRSPHVKIEAVGLHGDVILTLSREQEEEEQPCQCPGCSNTFFSSGPALGLFLG